MTPNECHSLTDSADQSYEQFIFRQALTPDEGADQSPQMSQKDGPWTEFLTTDESGDQLGEPINRCRDGARGRNGDDPGNDNALGDIPSNGGRTSRSTYADDRAGDRMGGGNGDAEASREEKGYRACRFGAYALDRCQPCNA